MARNKLTTEDVTTICSFPNAAQNMLQVAVKVGCSVRTVKRILVKNGLIKTQASVSDQARGFIRVLNAYEIESPKHLARILQERADGQQRLELTAKQEMNLENVQQFLNNCTKEQLAGLFYTSGLIKIAEMHNGSVMNATQRMQEAAKKGKVSYEPPRNYRQG